MTEGKEFELRVTVVPPLGPGGLVVPVTMKSSSTKMPEVTVTAYAMVQPAVGVNPPQLFLPAPPLTEPTEVSVSIQSKSTNALALSEPALDVKDAKIQLRELIPGKAFHLAMTFPAGFRLGPGEKVQARVKSNHPQIPLVTIPVFQEQPEEDAQAPAIPPASATNSATSGAAGSVVQAAPDTPKRTPGQD